jgi:hypothetical protein
MDFGSCSLEDGALELKWLKEEAEQELLDHEFAKDNQDDDSQQKRPPWEIFDGECDSDDRDEEQQTDVFHLKFFVLRVKDPLLAPRRTRRFTQYRQVRGVALMQNQRGFKRKDAKARRSGS